MVTCFVKDEMDRFPPIVTILSHINVDTAVTKTSGSLPCFLGVASSNNTGQKYELIHTFRQYNNTQSQAKASLTPREETLVSLFHSHYTVKLAFYSFNVFFFIISPHCDQECLLVRMHWKTRRFHIFYQSSV